MKEAGQEAVLNSPALTVCQGTSNTVFICLPRPVLIDQPNANGGSLPSLVRFIFV